MKAPRYKALAQAIQARDKCLERKQWMKGTSSEEGHAEWVGRWEAYITRVLKGMPSGSGIDSGTCLGDCRPDRLMLVVDYHHMNENGFYDGWTHHCLIIKPSLLHDFTIRITGPNRNDIKDYLTEVYQHVLSEVIDVDP